MTDLGKEFRIWVTAQRLRRDLTIGALAEKIGYPRRTVNAAINGAAYPHVIQAIASHLKHEPKKDGPLPTRPARPERRVRTVP